LKIKSVELEKEFIPEFNDNKDLPKEEQGVVEIKKHITNLQMAKYKTFSWADGKAVIEYDDTSIMALHVGNLRNFEDDNGILKDGAALADSTNKLWYPLMVEIRNFLLNASETLTEGE
jgi:phage terminase large subunit-like protein